ncbi:hypothetical protein LX32DRAFT_689385 [Colletotrichum zoysiae]|uniref:Uncharacterized protein n=1 Tax=Colletotrichum zoysiae TaxID=1216348 RepID=A0AAD9M4K8_9PEZI|nr:hypothetical protein LX32DRAFT_689385 [Colletotrichum zoysiae]
MFLLSCPLASSVSPGFWIFPWTVFMIIHATGLRFAWSDKALKKARVPWESTLSGVVDRREPSRPRGRAEVGRRQPSKDEPRRTHRRSIQGQQTSLSTYSGYRKKASGRSRQLAPVLPRLGGLAERGRPYPLEDPNMSKQSEREQRHSPLHLRDQAPRG